jgi:peptide/nickel transport system permease protein/peptide/nickel transport system substrate-binding protein
MAHRTYLKSLDRRTVLAGLAAGAAMPMMSPTFAQAKGSIVRASMEVQPSSLDPITGTNGGDFRFLYPIYDTLVDWDFATLKPVPKLATAWHFTDPKTFVMELRQNVTFHDGTPFNAEAVKFNLNRIHTDPKSNFKNDLNSVDSIEITGPYQLTMKLNRPNSALPAILSERCGLMASPAAIQKYGADFPRNPVGTGAWKFETWRDNEILSLVRNDKYWRQGYPRLDGITFRIIPDTSTGLRSVLAGESDIIYEIAPSQKAAVDRSSRVVGSFASTQAFYPVWFNTARAPLNDVRVRQAINYAIDRDGFNKATALGHGQVARGVLPKEHWAYDPASEKDYPYNPERAKALLKEAGHESGFDMVLMGPTDDRSRQRQEVVVEQLKRVGIRAQIKGLSVNDSIKAFFVDKSADALLILFGGRPDPSITMRDLFSARAFLNPARTEPQGLTEAIAASESSEDLAVRKQALAKVQRIVAENALMAPLVFDSQFTVMSKKISGYVPNLFGRLRFDGMSISS